MKPLAALAQDTRLAIFRLLVQAGPADLVAGQIAEALAVPAVTACIYGPVSYQPPPMELICGKQNM